MERSQALSKTLPFTLVLGGGGARGLAHVGVLKALERIEFVPSLIVGTSMGSLVGGMYSQLRSADRVEKKLRDFLEGAFFKRIGLEQFSETDPKSSRSVQDRFASHLRQRYYFSKSALGTGKFAQMKLIQSLRILLEEADIKDLFLRFAAVTSDLSSGGEYVFTSGSIIQAVAASSAIPGIVAPLEIGSYLFVDGKATSTIPVPAARRLSKNPIIAVDVRQSLGSFENHHHGFEIVIRAGNITSDKLNNIHLQHADIVLKPDVRDIHWNEFHRIDYCVHAGERIIEENIQQLTNRFRASRLRTIFHTILPKFSMKS
ncbi:MAG: patatin-like phospholipase family protein [Bacteroidota bacterium]